MCDCGNPWCPGGRDCADAMIGAMADAMREVFAGEVDHA